MAQKLKLVKYELSRHCCWRHLDVFCASDACKRPELKRKMTVGNDAFRREDFDC